MTSMSFQPGNRVRSGSPARRRPTGGWPLPLAVLAIAGCASGGGGSRQLDTLWKEDMGRMTRATLDNGVTKIVQKHNLRIDRQERNRPREIYIELAWISREVLAAEEARGITNARNRIVLRGQLLESGFSTTSEAYRVTWMVENEVTDTASTGWHPDAIPDEVVERFRPIFTELTMETRTGVWR